MYQVTTLLTWHKVKKLDKMSKEEKFEAWEKIIQKRTPMPPKCDQWTDDNENTLIKAGRMDLDISDTALGRLQAQKKVEFLNPACKFTQEEWDTMTAARGGLESTNAPGQALEINPLHNNELEGSCALPCTRSNNNVDVEVS
jgi:hypothetical protein